jgi:hypothetical protein
VKLAKAIHEKLHSRSAKFRSLLDGAKKEMHALG